ncbi:hypothetical protein ACLBXO_30375 [Methylobacterium sp. C33D]
MSIRCQVICEDDAAPAEHSFLTMPRAGDIVVFPGRYAIYEIAEIRHDRIPAEPASDGDSVITIVVTMRADGQRSAGLRA